jgi:hypothetical protein
VILAVYLAIAALLVIACDAVLFPKGKPMDCDLTSVHSDIVEVAEAAAELAFDEFADAAVDEHVIASAIVNVLINRSVVPPAIMADIKKHTRAAIEKRIAASAS